VRPAPPNRVTNGQHIVAVLGASGFIGTAAVSSLVEAGHTVLAFTRRLSETDRLSRAGAEPVVIRVDHRTEWTQRMLEADVVVDVTQPPVPERLTIKAANAIAAQRLEFTHTVTAAIRRITSGQRPLLLTVSGTDDLLPDPAGVLRGSSALRATPRGFGHIGIPVRRTIEATHLDAGYLYLGNVVLGDGKAFRHRLVPGVASGKVKVVGRGDNMLPVTHVDDAAAAVTHLVGLGSRSVAGRSFLAAPAAIAQRDFITEIARSIGVAPPGRCPAWVAAAAVGRVQAEVMTLDGHVDPTSLTGTGFRFRHPDPIEAISTAVPPTPVLC
jgi:NAD dependent epimerase/dehydratase family enzyme